MIFNISREQLEYLEVLELSVKKLLADEANKELPELEIIEKAVREKLKLKKNNKVVITKLPRVGNYKATLTSKSYKIIVTF